MDQKQSNKNIALQLWHNILIPWLPYRELNKNDGHTKSKYTAIECVLKSKHRELHFRVLSKNIPLLKHLLVNISKEKNLHYLENMKLAASWGHQGFHQENQVTRWVSSTLPFASWENNSLYEPVILFLFICFFDWFF